MADLIPLKAGRNFEVTLIETIFFHNEWGEKICCKVINPEKRMAVSRG